MTTSDAIDKLLEFVIPPYAGARPERIAEARQAIEQLLVEARLDEMENSLDDFCALEFDDTDESQIRIWNHVIERFGKRQEYLQQQLTKEEDNA